MQQIFGVDVSIFQASRTSSDNLDIPGSPYCGLIAYFVCVNLLTRSCGFVWIALRETGMSGYDRELHAFSFAGIFDFSTSLI